MILRLVGANKVMLKLYDYIHDYGLSAPTNFVGRSSHEVLVNLPCDAVLVDFISNVARLYPMVSISYVSNHMLDVYLKELKQ